MKYCYILFFSIFILANTIAQEGILKGKVTDLKSNEPIAYADIILYQSGDSAIFETTLSLEDGTYKFTGLPAGFYNLEIASLAYSDQTFYEVRVTNNKPITIDAQLEPSSQNLNEIVVKSSPFEEKKESPVSLRTLGVTEIRRNPGAAQDISKVFKVLPGVTAPAVTFRNDLLIRGGGPNENSFYIDGIEVPVINHFTTQGSSGGPAGMINTEFIRNVEFLSSAFPANRGNALSSVINFQMREGRDDRTGLTFNIGSTNAGLTMEGPISDKVTYLASVRRSYLQLLFSIIDLPFLPSYWDFQTKVKYDIDKNNKLSFIGIGAIDQLSLNQNAYDSETKAAQLEQIPELYQWNYTNGIVYKHLEKNGFWNLVLSRSMLNNTSEKYEFNPDGPDGDLIFDYRSREISNNFRLNRTLYFSDYKLSTGLEYNYIKFTNQSTINTVINGNDQLIDFESILDFHQYAGFAQLSKGFFNERFNVSAGLRMSGNTYSDEFVSPFNQLSPRLSLSYALTEKISVNAGIARYYQNPPLTILGYKQNGELVNRQNDIKPFYADHYVFGMDYITNIDSKISLEGYVKLYGDYPFLTRDSVNLANLGGDFQVVGNEPAISIGEGRTYGMEFFYQQRLYEGFYGSLSYTFGFSEFTDADGNYIPSSWDARHIFNITAGKQFNNGWEIGLSYRFQSSTPSTPFDPASSLVNVWDVNKEGIPDYDRLNSQRLGGANLVNLRIDKKWFFENWNLNLYLDVENVFGSTVPQKQLILDRPLDEDGVPMGDGVIINPDAPEDEQRYKTKKLTQDLGIVVPTLGVMVEI